MSLFKCKVNLKMQVKSSLDDNIVLCASLNEKESRSSSCYCEYARQRTNLSKKLERF
jgi:hypothetical protein